MSALDALAPDQRAVVALVLQQGRSYDEIAALLGLPADAVRARARAGLAALAHDNGLPGAVTGQLADYLLGQQAPADAQATRDLLAGSAPARAWAAGLAAQLAAVAPNALPAIPEPPRTTEAGPALPASAALADTDRPPARPATAAPTDEDSAPAASRLGGALLIAGVLAVVGVVLYLVLSGGEERAEEPVAASSEPAATATPAATAAPQVADTIRLRSATSADAKGTMTVYLQDGRLLFAIEAQGVPAGAAYGVWLTGPGDRARRLGFTNPVGEDGQLGIQGPGQDDVERFPRLYATYARVVVSRETTEDARRPSAVILSGKLPSGRSRG